MPKIPRLMFSALLLTALCAPAMAHGAYDWDTPPEAQCHLPKLEGRPYYVARQIILKAGYAIVPNKKDEYGFCASEFRDTCKELPELETCSMEGSCSMKFRHKDGSTLRIVTSGMGAPHPYLDEVDGWDISCTSDKKKPAK